MRFAGGGATTVALASAPPKKKLFNSLCRTSACFASFAVVVGFGAAAGRLEEALPDALGSAALLLVWLCDALPLVSFVDAAFLAAFLAALSAAFCFLCALACW